MRNSSSGELVLCRDGLLLTVHHEAPLGQMDAEAVSSVANINFLFLLLWCWVGLFAVCVCVCVWMWMCTHSPLLTSNCRQRAANEGEKKLSVLWKASHEARGNCYGDMEGNKLRKREKTRSADSVDETTACPQMSIRGRKRRKWRRHCAMYLMSTKPWSTVVSCLVTGTNSPSLCIEFLPLYSS